MQNGRPEFLESVADVLKYGITYNTCIKFPGTDVMHRVTSSHIAADVCNDYIFDELSSNKKEFCACLYGYEAGCGIWPEYNYEDYAACTRVVVALMALSELAMHEKRNNEIAELIQQRDELNAKIDALSASTKV